MRLSNLENMYQDFSGTPVTAAGQPVGLVVDKSQSQTLGSEAVINGDFETIGPEWTDVPGTSEYGIVEAALSVSSGEIQQEVTVELDKVYKVRGTILCPIGGKSISFGTDPLTQNRVEISTPLATKKVFIFVGQSNIDGTFVSLLDPAVDAQFQVPQDQYQIWHPSSLSTSSGSWVSADSLYGKHLASRTSSFFSQQTRYNPASLPTYDLTLPLIKKISEYESVAGGPEEELYVFKNTHPGTFIVSGIDSPWNQLSWTDLTAGGADVQGSGLYFTLINDVSAGIEALSATLSPGQEIEIKGIIFMQGESESGSTWPAQVNFPGPTDIAESWAVYFRIFYDRLQTDLKSIIYSGNTAGKPDFPFFLIKTHLLLNTGSNFLYVDIVREQQESVILDSTLNIVPVTVDSINNFIELTKVHFNASGHTQIADRVFSSYEDYYRNKRQEFHLSRIINVESYLVPQSSSLYISLHGPDNSLNYPNTFDNISVREVAGFHAKQSVAGQRPTLQEVGPYFYLDFDGVDDKLLVEIPGTVSGTAVISDIRGTAAYGINIPSGTFSIGVNSNSDFYSFYDSLLGIMTKSKPMDQSDIDSALQYFILGGASAVGSDSYQSVSDLSNYWRSASWIESFPTINTESVSSFSNTWKDCNNLKNFPAGLFDSTLLTVDFSTAFEGCSSLTEQSVDNILTSINNSGTSNGTITLPGQAPSSTGESAIDDLRSRGWTVTVTGGY